MSDHTLHILIWQIWITEPIELAQALIQTCKKLKIEQRSKQINLPENSKFDSPTRHLQEEKIKRLLKHVLSKEGVAKNYHNIQYHQILNLFSWGLVQQ